MQRPIVITAICYSFYTLPPSTLYILNSMLELERNFSMNFILQKKKHFPTGKNNVPRVTKN